MKLRSTSQNSSVAENIGLCPLPSKSNSSCERSGSIQIERDDREVKEPQPVLPDYAIAKQADPHAPLDRVQQNQRVIARKPGTSRNARDTGLSQKGPTRSRGLIHDTSMACEFSGMFQRRMFGEVAWRCDQASAKRPQDLVCHPVEGGGKRGNRDVVTLCCRIERTVQEKDLDVNIPDVRWRTGG